MSHSLIVKLRLDNASEGHGYYSEESGKSLLEYANQVEPELFWLLCKKSGEKCPVWVPVLYQWSMGYSAPEGTSYLSYLLLDEAKWGNLLSPFIYGQVILPPKRWIKKQSFLSNSLLIWTVTCMWHRQCSLFLILVSSPLPSRCSSNDSTNIAHI